MVTVLVKRKMWKFYFEAAFFWVGDPGLRKLKLSSGLRPYCLLRIAPGLKRNQRHFPSG
jgi:hypothetical protein